VLLPKRGNQTMRGCFRAYSCPRALFGYSVDDLFAYTAVKSVRIRDARLGLLHYGLMFAIFVYILIYQLLWQLHYLKFSDAMSTVRLQLQQPTTGGCNPNNSSCEDNFVALDDLAYCCNTSCSLEPSDGGCRCHWRPGFKNYYCTYLDGVDASVVRESSIFVTTFTHAYTQLRNPDCFSGIGSLVGTGNCKKVWNTQDSTAVFTTDVESYTILIDHSVACPGNDFVYTSQQMVGKLFVSSHGQLQDQLCASNPNASDSAGKQTSAAPCYLPAGDLNQPDIFSVGTLLQAAGVSLDSASLADQSHSSRYEGMVVNLGIAYKNTEHWRGVVSPSYVYNVSVANKGTYKAREVVSTAYPDKRVKQDLHGIQFQVVGGGQLAQMDFTSLLLQLTSSLTLVAMSTLVVNILATYVLRWRHYYNEGLYDSTPDRHDISSCERHHDSWIEQELQARNLPIMGTRESKVLRLLEHGWQPDATPVSSVGGVDEAPSRGLSIPIARGTAQV